jgi:hypothetical protein
MKYKVNVKDALPLILAGRSLFTIVSQKTGKRFTYKVNRCNEIYFIRIRIGTKYEYCMFINSNRELRGDIEFMKYNEDTGLNAFAYVYYILIQGGIPKVDFYHHGICCRCGRLLTVPESIKQGLGNDCLKKSKLKYGR